MNINNYKHRHRRKKRDRGDESCYEHWIKRLEQEKELNSSLKSSRSFKIKKLHEIFKKETNKEIIINWWSEDLYFLEIYDMNSSNMIWQSNLIKGVDNVMKRWLSYLQDYVNLPF